MGDKATAMATPAAPVAASGSTPRSSRARKQCSDPACTKVDAGGGFCVAHGGGKKCAVEGCTKGYQTGGFCRKHGGGARCQVAGCGKVDAGKGLCRAHGGGKRCQSVGCPRADVGGGFCTTHGGGKRCSEPGCTKIDQGGGKCRAHGGAKRCQLEECSQPARGRTGYCTRHGGARVCSTPNCRRLARGGANGTLCGTCIANGQSTAGSTTSGGSSNTVESIRARSPSSDIENPTIQSLLAMASDVGSPNNSPMTLRPMTPPNMSEMPDVAIESSASGGPCIGAPSVNCYANGCGASFGGRCNCPSDCPCNAAPATLFGKAGINQEQDATESMASIALQRVALALKCSDESKWLGIDSVLSLLKTVPGIRSVHDHSKRQPPESFEALHISEAVVIPDEFPWLVIVRGEEAFDPSMALLPLLDNLHLESRILDQSAIAWTRKEVTLRVPDMMCSGNCGSTVLNALRTVAHVEFANLVFELRHVIARGAMSADKLCSAVEDVGFEPFVEAVTPTPHRFRFRVDGLVDAHIAGARLERILKHVEGVENVVLVVERAEALVVAMLENAAPLLDVVMQHGFVMIEISEDGATEDVPMSFEPANARVDTQWKPQDEKASDDQGAHACDTKICAYNGCQQYRTVLAHTAALAVGWSIPGCDMSWGGECTCGENCKCKGCPEHNPNL